MNIFLWLLQVLLALHTAVGAVWKFSYSAGQTMPSLQAIPDWLWQGLGGLELLLALDLILPAFNKRLGILAPIAAICIAIEMLFFSAMHLFAGDSNNEPLVYWLVVAAICLLVAYGRFVLKPFNQPHRLG
ncbi:MAG TPA: DoxX family protein [Oculatellaceae cyanobacterium]|jgi:hypothetical protein